ncbi:MAG: HNH endonuclease signature motif containing protein [Pseudomonadota bacterium]
MSYELYVGKIPDGMIVRHKCDNPPCINPDHLEIGTHADNTRDMIERGRKHQQTSFCNRKSKLTESDVQDIRTSSMTLPQICAKYGIAKSTASYVRSGRTYKDV